MQEHDMFNLLFIFLLYITSDGAEAQCFIWTFLGKESNGEITLCEQTNLIDLYFKMELRVDKKGIYPTLNVLKKWVFTCYVAD